MGDNLTAGRANELARFYLLRKLERVNIRWSALNWDELKKRGFSFSGLPVDFMSKAPSLWNAAQSKYVVQNIRRINVIRVADLEQDASSRLVDLLQSEVAIANSALSSKLEVNAEANSSNTVSRLWRLESEKLRKLEGLLILVKPELQMIENTIT
eukprot:95166_1